MKKSVLICAVFLVSCSTAYQGLETANESGVTFIANRSEVRVEAKNSMLLDDSLSFEATQKVLKAIESNLVVGANTIIDCSEDESLHNDINNFLSIAASTARKNLTQLRVPASILDVAGQSPDRFAVVVWHDGFTKEKGIYGKQLAAGIGLAVLTTIATAGMATSYMIPLKANSRMTLLVIDKQTGQVAGFRFVDQEAEPLKENVITRELETGLEKIFR